mgnify:CR=1 FL=1
MATIITCDHGSNFPSCVKCMSQALALVKEHDRTVFELGYHSLRHAIWIRGRDSIERPPVPVAWKTRQS